MTFAMNGVWSVKQQLTESATACYKCFENVVKSAEVQWRIAVPLGTVIRSKKNVKDCELLWEIKRCNSMGAFG